MAVQIFPQSKVASVRPWEDWEREYVYSNYLKGCSIHCTAQFLDRSWQACAAELGYVLIGRQALLPGVA